MPDIPLSFSYVNLYMLWFVFAIASVSWGFFSIASCALLLEESLRLGGRSLTLEVRLANCSSGLVKFYYGFLEY